MKRWISIMPWLVVIVLLLLISGGYRFTALSAAKSNTFISNDAELMGQYDIGSSVLFLFKSDEEERYQTVLSEKSAVFYRSSSSAYIPYSSDKIHTVGGMSVTTRNDEATLLSVISYDEEVAYIEAGVEPNVERKEIKKGERISFLFPFSEQIDFLYPAAFNNDGKKLYYYGYPKDTNIIRSDDLKWHKIDGE